MPFFSMVEPSAWSHAPPDDLASSEADIADAATPAVAKAAGGLLLFAGLSVALTGVQLFAMVRLFDAYALVPHAHLALGAALGLCGLMIFRGRAWAASVAAMLSGALFLLTSAWLVFSFTHAVFSLLALGNPLAMLLALALAVVSIKPCERATEARARLAAQGLGFGL